MNIPAKSHYALKALLELSLHWPKQEPLAINTIAKRQDIPLKFLTQILLHLKAIGLVESIRGKQGGYILRKKPSRISLADILMTNAKQKRKKSGIIDEVLSEIDEIFFTTAKQITFEELVKRERRLTKTPMYTI